MTDRELLEAAAKAAGIYRTDLNAGVILTNDADGHTVVWNPLTDDGDALRLAVSLQILINPCGSMVAVTDGDASAEELVREHQDIYAATRRAIVRAAAIVGAAS